MRTNRGRGVDLDLDLEMEVRRESRSTRHASGHSADVQAARDAWEPIVCPHCGEDHPDLRGIRIKRLGRGFVARCTGCGNVAGTFVEGVWSA